GRTQFHCTAVDAEVRTLFGGVVDALEAGLDVEGEGLDRAVEASGGGGEAADGCHDEVPFACFGPRPSRPRWLSTGPGTIGPHPPGSRCACAMGWSLGAETK